MPEPSIVGDNVYLDGFARWEVKYRAYCYDGLGSGQDFFPNGQQERRVGRKIPTWRVRPVIELNVTNESFAQSMSTAIEHED